MDFHSSSLLEPATKRISGSREFIKFQNSDPLLLREFRAERDAILRRFRRQKAGGAHRRETETRRNTTAGIFEIQRRLVAFFFFSSFFSLSFFLLCPLMYDLQKRKKKKCCFDYSAESFSGKIFFSTRLGCLGSPPPSFERDSRRGVRQETGRHSVQVHPTDLNSWPE